MTTAFWASNFSGHGWERLAYRDIAVWVGAKGYVACFDTRTTRAKHYDNKHLACEHFVLAKEIMIPEWDAYRTIGDSAILSKVIALRR